MLRLRPVVTGVEVLTVLSDVATFANGLTPVVTGVDATFKVEAKLAASVTGLRLTPRFVFVRLFVKPNY